MTPEQRNALGDWAIRFMAFGAFAWACFIVWAVLWMATKMLEM